MYCQNFSGDIPTDNFCLSMNLSLGKGSLIVKFNTLDSDAFELEHYGKNFKFCFLSMKATKIDEVCDLLPKILQHRMFRGIGHGEVTK